MELTDKKVLITGGSSGMGRAMVEQLLERGNEVHSIDRDVFPVRRPTELHVHTADVGDEDAIGKIIGLIGSDLKDRKLDVVISNAGVLRQGGIIETTIDDMRLQMDVNVIGSWNIIRTVLKQQQLTRDGVILQMCSVVGLEPHNSIAGYSVSKAAVASMIELLRNDEIVTQTIKAAYPGAVSTPMNVGPDDDLVAYNRHMIEKWGMVKTPDEMATMLIKLLEHDDMHNLTFETADAVQDYVWD